MKIVASKHYCIEHLKFTRRGFDYSITGLWAPLVLHRRSINWPGQTTAQFVEPDKRNWTGNHSTQQLFIRSFLFLESWLFAIRLWITFYMDYPSRVWRQAVISLSRRGTRLFSVSNRYWCTTSLPSITLLTVSSPLLLPCALVRLYGCGAVFDLLRYHLRDNTAVFDPARAFVK